MGHCIDVNPFKINEILLIVLQERFDRSFSLFKLFVYLAHMIRTDGTKISKETAIRMCPSVTVVRCRVDEVMLTTVKVLDMR